MALGLIAGIANAAGTLYQNKQNQQFAQDQIQQRIDASNALAAARRGLVGQALDGTFLSDYGVDGIEFGLDDIFGRKPVGIEFQAPDLATSNQNFLDFSVPGATEAADVVNARLSRSVLDNNLMRIRELFPDFDRASESFSGATADLLAGRLPFEDVMDIISDRQSLAGSVGTFGTQTNATLKDLGLSKLDAIQTGGNMFQQFAQTLNSSVSPIPQNFASGASLLPFTTQTPELQLRIAENEQASAQGAEFLSASPDPAASQLFRDELFNAMLESGIGATGQAIPPASFNPGSAFTQGLSAVSQLNRRGGGINTLGLN